MAIRSNHTNRTWNVSAVHSWAEAMGKEFYEKCKCFRVSFPLPSFKLFVKECILESTHFLYRITDFSMFHHTHGLSVFGFCFYQAPASSLVLP